MIKIIIKLIEFFLNSGLIPSQKDQMPQKIFPMLTKIMFENIKCDKINFGPKKNLGLKKIVDPKKFRFQKFAQS